MDVYQVELGALILVWAFINTILCVYRQWRFWRCCAQAQTCLYRGWSNILAWELVTRSCLKPQNQCSNHEIHVLFEHGFYLKKPKLGPDLHAWRYTGMRCGCDWLFADAFFRENVAHVYMTLWRLNDVRKLTLTPLCFEKSSVRKGIFNV